MIPGSESGVDAQTGSGEVHSLSFLHLGVRGQPHLGNKKERRSTERTLRSSRSCSRRVNVDQISSERSSLRIARVRRRSEILA